MFGPPKVPITLEKVMMKPESRAGRTRGRVILRRMRQRLAPISSPASSRLESIDINAAETNRKKKV